MVSAWASSGPSGSAKGYVTPRAFSFCAATRSSSQVFGASTPASSKSFSL